MTFEPQPQPGAISPAPKFGVDLTTRDLSWFQQKVEQGRLKPFSEVVTITPAIAKRLLELNHDNRNVVGGGVDAIANDILSNHWKLNGESIIVSRDGYLNDGQHRLLAVIKADKPIQSVVMFGVDRDSRMTVDMGRARSVGHFLHMKGRGYVNFTPTVAKLLLAYQTGKVAAARGGGHGAFTKQDILARALRFGPEVYDAISRVGNSEFGRTVRGGAYLSAAYLILHEHHPENCELFFDKLLTGAGLEPDSAILWLRTRLYEAANSSARGLSRAEDRLEVVLRYYNAFMKDKTITRHIYTTGNFPKLEV
jgi:hypothetical protein